MSDLQTKDWVALGGFFHRFNGEDHACIPLPVWRAAWEDVSNREQEALRQIDEWAKAYPLDVFPEPDLKRAHEVLEAAGLSLGAISAHAMRHVLTGVQKIAAAAIDKAKEPKP